MNRYELVGGGVGRFGHVVDVLGPGRALEGLLLDPGTKRGEGFVPGTKTTLSCIIGAVGRIRKIAPRSFVYLIISISFITIC